MVILIGADKCKNQNVFHLWTKENSSPLINKIIICQSFQRSLHLLCFNAARTRRKSRSNDKLEPIRSLKCRISFYKVDMFQVHA